MYAVFTKDLIIDKEQLLVSQYEGDYNAYAIHKELRPLLVVNENDNEYLFSTRTHFLLKIKHLSYVRSHFKFYSRFR